MGSIGFPPPPSDTVDWNRLGITAIDVAGHVECKWTRKTGTWSIPTFVEDPYVKVHGLAPGLNYGQQAYEGVKACRSPTNDINIFRPAFHAKRLIHSASYVSIPEIPESVFLDAVELAVAKNAMFVPPHDKEALLYIRPLVFGSAPSVALIPPEEYTFVVYVTPGNSYHGVKPLDALILEDFDRAAPFGTGCAKVGGNYAPVIRHSDKARAQGFPITLHLDSQTRTEVDEFSTSGFVGIKYEGDSFTMVVPDSKNIIQSVTSDSCFQLGKSFGWKVEKRSIKYEEIPSFDEIAAVGTAAAMLPIKSISRFSTGDKFVFQDGRDAPGPCTAKLYAALKAIQKGDSEDQFGWRWKVLERV